MKTTLRMKLLSALAACLGLAGCVPAAPGYAQAGDTAYATQHIDLTPFAAQIDAGAAFDLSARMGGRAAEDDFAMVTLTFDDASGATVGSAHVLIGPDAAERRGQTGLERRSLSGHVPRGARTASLLLEMVGFSAGANDAHADNISLILHAADAEQALVTD